MGGLIVMDMKDHGSHSRKRVQMPSTVSISALSHHFVYDALNDCAAMVTLAAELKVHVY